MLPWASGHDYAGCTVRLSSWCPGVGICGPVLPTLMTRLHHSGLLSNKSYLITGQIYQSDVIIYTSILELSLEFKLQELLLFFILKYHATVNANGQLTCNIMLCCKLMGQNCICWWNKHYVPLQLTLRYMILWMYQKVLAVY